MGSQQGSPVALTVHAEHADSRERRFQAEKIVKARVLMSLDLRRTPLEDFQILYTTHATTHTARARADIIIVASDTLPFSSSPI